MYEKSQLHGLKLKTAALRSVDGIDCGGRGRRQSGGMGRRCIRQLSPVARFANVCRVPPFLKRSISVHAGKEIFIAVQYLPRGRRPRGFSHRERKCDSVSLSLCLSLSLSVCPFREHPNANSEPIELGMVLNEGEDRKTLLRRGELGGDA